MRPSSRFTPPTSSPAANEPSAKKGAGEADRERPPNGNECVAPKDASVSARLKYSSAPSSPPRAAAASARGESGGRPRANAAPCAPSGTARGERGFPGGPGGEPPREPPRENEPRPSSPPSPPQSASPPRLPVRLPARLPRPAAAAPPLAVRSMGSGIAAPGARAARTNLSFISAVMFRSSSVISSNCTCSMYECGMYVPSSPNFDPASTTAARTLPWICVNDRSSPSIQSIFTLRSSSLHSRLRRFMIAPTSYPSAMSPPKMRTPTSNLILGEIMTSPSLIVSSNIKVYRPSRLRMRSHDVQVSGSSCGGSR